MAIRIRCTDCDKKISIDEAFAGGVCRCPFCKALVMVPGDSSTATRSARPSAPSVRPDAPPAQAAAGATSAAPAGSGAVAQAVAGSGAVAQGSGGSGLSGQSPRGSGRIAQAAANHVPVARPDRTQMYISLVAIVLLVAMMIFGGIMFFSSRPGSTPANTAGNNQLGGQPIDVPQEVNPYISRVGGPSIAGDAKVQPPVLYVVDCSGSNEETFDVATLLVRQSIRTLAPQNKFTLLLSMGNARLIEEPGKTAVKDSLDELFAGGYTGGGAPGAKEVRQFVLASADRLGARSDLTASLKHALGLKPATLVLLARRAPDDADLQRIAELAGTLTKITTVIIEPVDEKTKQSLQKLSKDTGGESRSLDASDLKRLGEPLMDKESKE